MHFSGGINRPPYETADGYLQTTEGCSHNTCLFCTYFKDQKFRKSTIEEIEEDIKEIPAVFGAPKRIFLQGADGYAADYDVLMKTAELLHKYVPSVQTIGGYARIDNFYDKSEDQLRNMAAAGFANPYIGVESGDDVILKRINKGYTAARAREQLEKIDAAGLPYIVNFLNAAGIGHCDLLMLGTAGKGRGPECARASAKLENEIRPKKILINTMSAFVGTKLDENIKSGTFIPASEKENLEEERGFLAELELPDCYFWALHPLDSVKLDGILREKKQQICSSCKNSSTRQISIASPGESRYSRGISSIFTQVRQFCFAYLQ